MAQLRNFSRFSRAGVRGLCGAPTARGEQKRESFWRRKVWRLACALVEHLLHRLNKISAPLRLRRPNTNRTSTDRHRGAPVRKGHAPLLTFPFRDRVPTARRGSALAGKPVETQGKGSFLVFLLTSCPTSSTARHHTAPGAPRTTHIRATLSNPCVVSDIKSHFHVYIPCNAIDIWPFLKCVFTACQRLNR